MASYRPSAPRPKDHGHPGPPLHAPVTWHSSGDALGVTPSESPVLTNRSPTSVTHGNGGENYLNPETAEMLGVCFGVVFPTARVFHSSSKEFEKAQSWL
uniref:Uncharacterized protein n=1 Tax=Knipowitschia caucasica TaxID=637954 RepID=A0AAV2JEE8_KNICA